MVDKLKDYLYGASLEVKTDNNPLTKLLTRAKQGATGHRWLAALSGFQFSLKYRPGVRNQNADALSQRPHGPSTGSKGSAHVTSEKVQALCQGIEHRHKGAIGAEAIGVTQSGVLKCHCDLTQVKSEGLPQLSKKDLKADQREDSSCHLTGKALTKQEPSLLL